MKKINLILISIFCSFLSGSLFATPKIQSWTTKNGAKVVFVAAPEIPMIDIRVVFDAGSARDGEQAGIALLTSDLLTEGAGRWSANQIAERMASVGSALGSTSAKDMAWITLRSLTDKEALHISLETMEAVINRPRFNDKDFSRQIQNMMIGLRREQQSPSAIASQKYNQILFGDYPYGHRSGGTKESIPQLTRDQVFAFHQRYFVGKNAIIAIVGAVKRAQAQAIAEQLTQSMPSGEHAPALPLLSPTAKGTETRIHFPSSQTHIRMGQIGVNRDDPDYLSLYVGNHILGGSGLVSMLAEEVREKRGLSYSVYSYLSPMRVAGQYTFGAQTKTEKTDEALSVMRATLGQFIKDGPEKQRLIDAKKNITGGFPLKVASNKSIAQYIAMIAFYDLPLDYLDTFVERINAIDATKIKDAFARRVDPDKMVTVIVGKNASKKIP